MMPPLRRPMALALLLFVTVTLTGQSEQTSDERAAATGQDETGRQIEETPPARVVLRINRNREVAGYVELEDENVIVIRRLDGEMESFSKSRILKIVHLVDASPGQRGTVILRNGQRTQGLILTDGFKQVVVEVEGIPITFKRSAVDEVRLDPTIDEQYAQFKATLDPAHAGR
ncbi:MAG: hypothetical protein ACYTGR_17395, partial [Planctomycetota bacterium]